MPFPLGIGARMLFVPNTTGQQHRSAIRREMAKYDSLEAHLRELPSNSARLTFAEINVILPSPLPRSAYEYSPFWSNTTVGSTHVWADAWQRAGWRVAGHSLEQQYVDFRRYQGTSHDATPGHAGNSNEPMASQPEEKLPVMPGNDGPTDEEEKQLVAIRTRRGQADFRHRLHCAYGAVCAIRGSTVEPLLEAAHIVPHALETNYATSNGLLLRADIHTLFDLHLIAVDADGCVAVSRSLEWTEYAQFRGRRLVAIPPDAAARPAPDQLKRHHNLFLACEEALDA
ncbi:HNH endonuclease [Paraburkholderia agricolaris]|uniref:HNH endonuclease n=1 Tax=Paraburkholderia agricolaris TaxID=2152888 RepID=UPI0038BB3459